MNLQLQKICLGKTFITEKIYIYIYKYIYIFIYIAKNNKKLGSGRDNNYSIAYLRLTEGSIVQ